jgi:hypothetical protein
VSRRFFILAAAFTLAAAPAARADELPMQLPGEASVASVRADADTWIVGARPDAVSRRIARSFGARRIGVAATGSYVVARDRARAFAQALGLRLVYAQADTLRTPAAVADDPLSGPPNDWRRLVVSPALDPPLVTNQSPLIALVDVAADVTHPEWTGDPWFASSAPQTAVTSPHGTETASVAAAPANGVGILGVWPGARALNVPLRTQLGPADENGDRPLEISCSASADAIGQAIAAGAAVINMSYGSTAECTAEKIQIYYAIHQGAIAVAAAGNEFNDGNPLEFPASLPHVVTVAATTSGGRSADFSNVNDAIDLSAPGVGIMAAIPPTLDTAAGAGKYFDGVSDGYTLVDGTSFAAPMVSAGLAWVREARPDLQPDQVVNAVRLSATDVAPKGWDALTGFGVMNVGNALALPASKIPASDPDEPNDNLVWVDGRAFGKPADAIWSGGAPVRVHATLDKEEDPVDVYRIVIPGHHSAKVSTVPDFGDVQLAVFRSAAVSVNDTGARMARSATVGATKPERVTVTNTGTAGHSYFVAVTPQGRSNYQDREYALRVG